MPSIIVSTVIEQPPEKVWAALRDYNGLAGWMPGVKGSEIEGGGKADAVGAVRVMDIGIPGEPVREELKALSDDDMTITYEVLNGPLPVDDFVATMRLRPITETGGTFGEWEASFVPADGAEEKAPKLLNRVFSGGWQALADYLAKSG